MKLENLAAGNELSGRINKAAKKLESLQPGRVSILLCPNKTTTQLLTIGTGDNCEHPLAALANDFFDNVRAHYAAELETLKAEFEAL